jgi:hypothetical protein
MTTMRGTARRVLASIVAPLIVASTAVATIAITAPAADAFSGSASLGCRLYFADAGTGSSPSTYTDTFSLTLSPASPAPGDTVTVTLAGTTGTLNGPIALAPNLLTVVAAIDLSGASTGTVTVLSSTSANNYPSAANLPPGDADGKFNPNTPLGPYTATGTFVASSAGTVTAALKQLKFDDGRYAGGSGADADTYCTDASTALSGGVDPKAAPVVSSTVKQAATVGSGGSTSTPTATPTTSSATPTPTTSSPTPTPTTSSPTPTPTSATPTPTGSSASPTPTPTATGVSGSLACTTLGQTKPWTTSFSASLTGSTLNLKFAPGPENGPVPIQANWMKATAKVKAPVDVSMEAVPYGAIAAREPIPGTTMSGAVTGAPTSLTLTEVVFDDFGSGSDVDTTCVPSAAITVPVASSPELPDTLPTSTGDLDVNPDTVTAGGTVTFSGGGFAPGSNATAGMYSTPVALGVGTADSAGDITVDVTIPSGTTGSHTLILYGVDNSGGVVALTKTVTVTAATSTPTPTDTTDPTDDPDPDNDGGLPKTGPEDFAMTLLWGAVALQIGLIVAVRASRSRGAASPAGKHRR